MEKMLFSSDKKNWETPIDLFDKYNKIYNFKIDLAASESNKLCDKYYDEEADSLTKDWKETAWLNPPYGRDMYKWIEKAYIQHKKHNTIIVMLLPSRTDTKWFHNFVLNKGIIHFIKGRLKFSNSKNAAPFPSMIVIFDNTKKSKYTEVLYKNNYKNDE